MECQENTNSTFYHDASLATSSWRCCVCTPAASFTDFSWVEVNRRAANFDTRYASVEHCGLDLADMPDHVVVGQARILVRDSSRFTRWVRIYLHSRCVESQFQSESVFPAQTFLRALQGATGGAGNIDEWARRAVRLFQRFPVHRYSAIHFGESIVTQTVHSLNPKHYLGLRAFIKLVYFLRTLSISPASIIRPLSIHMTRSQSFLIETD